MLMKNSKDNIGNRTSDLPACSAVPQPTAASCAPKSNCTTAKVVYNIMSYKSSNSFGYNQVPTKIFNLSSHFISSSLNYTCNRTFLSLEFSPIG